MPRIGCLSRSKLHVLIRVGSAYGAEPISNGTTINYYILELLLLLHIVKLYDDALATMIAFLLNYVRPSYCLLWLRLYVNHNSGMLYWDIEEKH